jgi:hypothetical protein
MRTPLYQDVRKSAVLETKPGAAARDGATVSRPFADILAEAESVQDVVRLSGQVPHAGIGSPAWQDAWEGLRRGMGRVLGTEAPLPPVLRSRMRRIGR